MRHLIFFFAVGLTACGGTGGISTTAHTSVGTSGSGSSTGTASAGGSGGTVGSTGFTNGTTSLGTTGNSTAGNGSTGTDGSGCSDQAKLVYVVDENNTFSSFDPSTSPPTFHDIGTLNCPDNVGTPFSMSVDRSAVAWVLYSDGRIFKVDTTTLACTDSGFSPNNGYSQFGMGFVADTNGGTTDSLFVAKSGGLGRLDTGTLKVTTVGTFSGQPELTGTGSAQLWGFFPDLTPVKIALIDKTNATLSNTLALSQLNGTPTAWAWAFWGGDFWIFLDRTSDNSTNVWQVNGQTGALSEPILDSGRTIVGAGVSSCAPITFQ
jgi:hypothetical protein